jgi:ribonuclease-3
MTTARNAHEGLEASLGYHFSNNDLLTQALTHRGAAHNGAPSNERLEFLGDRVLGLVIAGLLVRCFPEAEEGELSRRLTALVRRDALAKVARQIGLAQRIYLAPSDAKTGRENPGLLADACEAVIGAMFLDGGLGAARTFIEAAWAPMLDNSEGAVRDAKTRLQEWAQARGRAIPLYEIAEREGPAHAPKFVVVVKVEGESEARGEGTSKRAAEQVAALALLERMETEARKS